jgi:hypothetical protein
VRKRSGFKVEYGPVRAADLPEYLKARQATPEMRRVRFTLLDRLILIPMELVHFLLPMLLAAIVLYLAGGPLPAMGAVAAVLAGVVLFPILLPWLPTHDFSTKGFILGGAVALPFTLTTWLGGSEAATWWWQAGCGSAYLLTMAPVTAYLALNFTGATPFTSKSGVRREMFAYIPAMAYTFGIGIVLIVVLILIRGLGG